MIRVSRFLGNVASGAQGALGLYSTYGQSAYAGGVFNGAYLEIWDSTFSANRCTGGGSFLGPGLANGGAICSTNTLVINECTFDNNSGNGGGTGCGETIYAGAPAEGGGVWASGVMAATNSTFTTNQAIGGAGSNGGWPRALPWAPEAPRPEAPCA